MTDRDRFVRCVLGHEADRPPFWLTPPPDTVLDQWREDGLDAEDWPAIRTRLGCENGPESVPVRCGPWPWPAQEDGFPTINVYNWGVTEFFFEKNLYSRRSVDHPVKSAEDWRLYKERLLRAGEPGRFDPEWVAAMQECASRGTPISFGDQGELVLLDAVAAMIGPKNCIAAARSDRDTLIDMLEHISKLYVAILGQVLDAHVPVDMVLLSDFNAFSFLGVDEFLDVWVEAARRIVHFARARGIPVIAFDEPPFCETMVPILREMGVNCLMGVTDHDVGELRQAYPALGVTGGIYAHELAEGRAAIDECLKRVRGWVAAGRYIPDIASVPFMPWEDFEYFAAGLRDAIQK